jgi:fluoride exporter
MQAYVDVFIGAGLGGALRHFVNLAIGRAAGTDFRSATALINVSGSFAMGSLVGWLAFRAGANWTKPVRFFVATGILCGYTTSILLIERNRIGYALAYVGGSVTLGILGLWAGLSLVRGLT